MKKKILIVSHALELGGAERSLIGLLSAFNMDKYEVDLFLLRHEGELMNMIPKGVNLLPEISAYTVLARPMIITLREGHVLLTCARLVGKLVAKLYDKFHGFADSMVALEYSHKYTLPFLPKIQSQKEYDLAISFLTPHYVVDKKVKAKKKIAWIHTDYEKVQVNISSERKMWGQYDYIASISDAVTENFLGKFPDLQEKIVLIENILPKDLIEVQKKEFIPNYEMLDKGIKLLSIGRYCIAKNFDNVPDICNRLVNSGLDVYWYIIGFGGDEDLIRKKIKQFHMEERVILLGKKDNPYPYIDACDFYVQPSRYEGKCVTVREAQMLAKPVIITKYATSENQLDENIDGIIVPMDNEGCAWGIIRALNDCKLIEQLIKNCKQRDYSNVKELEKIYKLIE